MTDERLVDIVAERFDGGIRLGLQVVRDIGRGPDRRTPAVGRRRDTQVPRSPRTTSAAQGPARAPVRRARRVRGRSLSVGVRKGGRERQVAVTGAMFENAPRIALRAALTGEVIGFAFEAHVAPHLANGTLASVLDDWCPSFPGFRLSVAASRISVNIAPLATLLHAATAPGLFCDVAAPPFSPQASDSSTGSALLLAPALSCDVAGPMFDSRRLHKT